MKKLLLLAIVVLGFSAVSFGQSGNVLTESATASAKLLDVLTIDNTSGTLCFGAMTVPQAAATVRSSYGKEREVIEGSGKISLLQINPQIDVPAYAVSGEPEASFTITLPGDVPLGTGVTVSNWQCSRALTSDLDDTGAATFTIGADLLLTTEAVADDYSETFEITVAYQ